MPPSLFFSNFAFMSTLNNKLLNDAVGIGLCAEHTEGWNPDWSKSDLIDYYKANPDWCLEKHFPSLAFLKEHFNDYETKQKGVFVDSFVTLRATQLTYIFNNCKVGVITNSVTRLYFGLNTEARIIVEDGGDLVIDCYDKGKIDVELRGSARLVVYKRGDYEINVTGSKNFKIRDKHGKKIM